jgi:hypothetical protein
MIGNPAIENHPIIDPSISINRSSQSIGTAIIDRPICDADMRSFDDVRLPDRRSSICDA